MRVIGGQLKGRTFDVKLKPTRPTTDFAREGLYNILQSNWEFPEVKFLDLFAGTGAHSFEFASRGCPDVTAIDSFHGSTKFIKETAVKFGIDKQVQAINTDVFRFLEGHNRQYDIIFADPPYQMADAQKLIDIVLTNKLLTDDGWFILEHSTDNPIIQTKHLFHERKYGGCQFSFFRYQP